MYVFHTNSLIQKNFSDDSTMRCLLISVIPDKPLQSSLAFMLSFRFIFNYPQFQCRETVVLLHFVQKCSPKFQKIYKKVHALESLFNKVAGLHLATLL